MITSADCTKKIDRRGKLVAPLIGRLPGQRMDWFPHVTGGNKNVGGLEMVIPEVKDVVDGGKCV